ncbi:hypothetical protein [Rhizobium phage RHph_X2_26]|nr:hypothetical protein [Rhizobium phage RHph_X2_26]
MVDMRSVESCIEYAAELEQMADAAKSSKGYDWERRCAFSWFCYALALEDLGAATEVDLAVRAGLSVEALSEDAWRGYLERKKDD